MNNIYSVELPTASCGNGQEIDSLSKEIKSCIEYAKQISIDHDKTWKYEVNRLAELIEKRYMLLDQAWLICHISEEITKIYRDNNIIAYPFLYKYLPEKYKNKDQANSLGSSQNDFYEDLEESLKNVSKIRLGIAAASRDFVSDAVRKGEIEIALLQQMVRIGRKRAELENIALEPDEVGNSKNKRKNQVNIDKPKPRGSLMYDALKKRVEKTLAVMERVFEFPPQILEMDKEIADAIIDFDSWMEPVLDLKYSKSEFDWFNVEKYRDIFGKHAAAVMSFSVTNLCANCSDEKTKEWVRMDPIYGDLFDSYECLQCHFKLDAVCPVCNVQMRRLDKNVVGWHCSNCDGTTPITRDLTREQVGDKSSILIEAVEKKLREIPVYLKFQEWFKFWIEPYVAGRKTRLHSDLSDVA